MLLHRRRGTRCRSSAAIAGACRAAVTRLRRLARRVRGELDAATTRSTSTCARAATPASTRLPRAGDRLQLPDRPRRSARATASACASATPPARSTSSAPRRASSERFDLVLDLQRPRRRSRCTSRRRATSTPADDARARSTRCCELRESVGEFEKPKFFSYKQKICAHSRNEQIGCTACIDVCSAQAIRSDASMKGRNARAQPAAASSSSRTCASAAAPCTHGLPERRDRATRTRGTVTRAGACARCSRPTRAGGSGATPPRC